MVLLFLPSTHMIPSTATSLKAAQAEFITNTPTRIKIGSANKPKNTLKPIDTASAKYIQAFLFKNLSIRYPISGFTSQANMVMLLMTIIFSAGKCSVSLR